MPALFGYGAISLWGLGPIGIVVLLMVMGLLFLGAELFIFPGFGIAGILGIVLLAGGALSAWTLLGSFWGVVVALSTVALSILLTVVAWRSKAIRKRFVLDTQLDRGGGTAAADLTDLAGARGEAKSDLHPAGIALFGTRRVDVVSDGGFIESGQQIKVVQIDGPRVVVTKITPKE